jgi:HEAT repeats
MMFCQELERTAARYPAPIVVTSRIVGYRDMPYRMGSGFEHGVIIEFTQLVRHIEQVSSEEQDFRRFLFFIVSNIRTDNGEITTSLLVSNLNSASADVRSAVIAVLGHLGDKLAVAPLLAKLDEPDDDVRLAAIRALGQLGDKLAVAPLLSRLDDANANVRLAAIEVLG